MIGYALQIAGITLLCVTAFLLHPAAGVAATGLMMVALGVSMENSKPKADK